MGEDTPTWSVSQAGNLTLVSGRRRVTLFQRGRGWRYAVAILGNEGAANYSGTFKTLEAAKKAGLKKLGL